MNARMHQTSESHERVRGWSRIQRLLNCLSWKIPLIVMISVLGAGYGYFLLQTIPLARVEAKADGRVLSESVSWRFLTLSSQLEGGLAAISHWHQSGVLEPHDIGQFNQLILPVIAQWPVRSVWLMNDDGQGVALEKLTTGWVNRELNDKSIESDRVASVKSSYWIDFYTLAKVSVTKEEWSPFHNSWLADVWATPEATFSWSAPGRHFLSDNPSVVVATHWIDAKTRQRWMVSFVVDLLDLSLYTSGMSVGDHGQVALLTAEGRVIGLPKAKMPVSEDAIRQSVLGTPRQLGLYALATAWDEMVSGQGKEPIRTTFVALVRAQQSGEGRQVVVALQPIQLGGERFFIATMQSTELATKIFPQLNLSVLLMMLVVSVTAFVVSRWVVRGIRHPLTQVFSAVESEKMAAERQAKRRSKVAQIVSQLQQTNDPQTFGQVLLDELAEPLSIKQSVFCLVEETSQTLRPLACYAGDRAILNLGEDPALLEIWRGSERAGLLLQSVKSRSQIVLDHPDAEYYRIHSGLGDMLPRAIVIRPVVYGERIYGVLELAIDRAFSEGDDLLLRELEPMIALTLDILLRSERTTNLLVETAEHEEQHRLILGAVGDGIWGMDVNGVTTFVNKMALQLLGYAEEEVVGQQTHALIHNRFADGNFYPRESCPMYLTMQDGLGRSVDNEVLWTKAGQALPVEYLVTALHHGDSIVGAVVVFRDITQRIAAAREQKNTENLLWQILDDSPCAAAIVSADGRVLKSNAQLAKLLGVEEAFFEDHLITEFWADPVAREKYLAALEASSSIHNFRTTAIRRDGGIITINISARWVMQAEQKLLLAWIEDVSRFSEAIPDKEPSAILAEEDHVRLVQLNHLLSEADACALDFWQQNHDAFASLLGAKARLVEDAIGRFDFDQALVILAQEETRQPGESS